MSHIKGLWKVLFKYKMAEIMLSDYIQQKQVQESQISCTLTGIEK